METIMELEREDGCTVRVYPDPNAPSPRSKEYPAGQLGHLLTWGAAVSPDENRYSRPSELFAELIETQFRFDELHSVLKSEAFDDMRFKTDKLGREHLVVKGAEGWRIEGRYEYAPSLHALATAIADSSKAVALLGQKIAIRPIYFLDGAYSPKPFGEHAEGRIVGVAYAAPKDVEAFSRNGEIEPWLIESMLGYEVEEYSAWANKGGFRVEVEKPDGSIESCDGLIAVHCEPEDVLEWSREILPLIDKAA